MLKKEVILEGLDCANCAAKIEDEVNKLNGVKAYMNFMNKTLTLETESEQEYKNTLQQVKPQCTSTNRMCSERNPLTRAIKY